jgi:metal-responsive CopG/Arc/MetJ family transcriptional regulator
MKEKTSITLSSDLLAEIDRNARPKLSRSAFIEAVIREYFKEKVRHAIYERDLQILNANADYFNREMEDVLRYQAPIEWTTEDD